MTPKVKRLFIVVIALQVVFLLGIVGYRETILTLGRTAVLQTVPVDPRDLVRGEFVELRTRDGLRLRVRTGTSDFRTSRSVLVDRSYFYGAGPLPANAVVIDAGAHMGSFSMLAASMAPQGRVLSYEPEPSNFDLLNQNVALNGFTHVTTFNRAVAGTEGERTLSLSLKPSTTGGHSLHRDGDRSITVTCTTLDAIVRDNALDRIDFLKLDCEGAEVEFIRDAVGAARRAAAGS